MAFKGCPGGIDLCPKFFGVVVDGVVPMGIYPLKFSIDAGKERVTVRHGRMGTVSLPGANKVGFPSGQREQTVNLPAKPSEVQILPPPPPSASTPSPGRCRALTIGRVHRQVIRMGEIGNPSRILRPHRLARSRTPAFHAGDRGSNPLGDATFLPKRLATAAGLFIFKPGDFHESTFLGV